MNKLLLLFSLTLIFSCTNNGYKLNEPKSFIKYIVKTSQSSNILTWKTVISSRLNEKGDDYVNEHLKVWGKEFKKISDLYTIDSLYITYDVDRNRIGIKTPEETFHLTVIKLDGKFYIDEN